ncbi:DUF6011 domain-containing protein [Streptomyces sp. NPDC056309]|uniref:DUF6011 domain-containing protein n=1 Tax=Streptomyces sp. NPDC056309 TaxID=3345781 RepID=UPI0035DC142A
MTDPTGEEEPAICLGGCGRLLTSDLSKQRGFGMDCWRKLHGRPARQPRPTTPTATEPGPGQGELPLTDQLELWTNS